MRPLLLAFAVVAPLATALAAEETTEAPAVPVAAEASAAETTPVEAGASDARGMLAAIERGERLEENLEALMQMGYDGDKDAQLILGDMHMEGRWVYQNASKAWTWYRRAAGQGDTKAMIKVAQLFETGAGGVPRHSAKAREWYTRAADAGDMDAMRWLLKFYTEGGEGLPPDLAKAYEWREKLAHAERAVAEEAQRKAREEALAAERVIEQAEATALVTVVHGSPESAGNFLDKILARLFGASRSPLSALETAALDAGGAVAGPLSEMPPFETDKLEDPGIEAFARRYVAAVNGRAAAGLKQVLHPESLKCGGALLDRFVAREIRRPIPVKYRARMRAVGPEEALFFEDEVRYPVRPTHRLRLEFDLAKGKSTTILRDLVKDGETWSLLIPCPLD